MFPVHKPFPSAVQLLTNQMKHPTVFFIVVTIGIVGVVFALPTLSQPDSKKATFLPEAKASQCEPVDSETPATVTVQPNGEVGGVRKRQRHMFDIQDPAEEAYAEARARELRSKQEEEQDLLKLSSVAANFSRIMNQSHFNLLAVSACVAFILGVALLFTVILVLTCNYVFSVVSTLCKRRAVADAAAAQPFNEVKKEQ